MGKKSELYTLCSRSPCTGECRIRIASTLLVQKSRQQPDLASFENRLRAGMNT